MSRKLTNLELFQFFNKLDLLIRISNRSASALRSMYEAEKDSVLKDLYGAMAHDLSEGKSWSEAVERSGAFPAWVSRQLKVGEKTGKAHHLFPILADYYHAEDEIWEAIRNAVMYPVIMGSVTLIIFGTMIRYISPIYEQVTKELNIPSGIAVRICLAFSQISPVVLLLLLTAALIPPAVAAVLCFTSWGNRRLSDAADRLRFAGNLAEQLATARFTNGLQMVVSSGQPLLYGLKLSYDLTSNTLVHNRIQECIRMLQSREFRPVDALRLSGLYTGEYADWLVMYERTGRLSEGLTFIARQYHDKMSRRLQHILRLFEPLMTGVLAVFIIFFTMSIISPLVKAFMRIG